MCFASHKAGQGLLLAKRCRILLLMRMVTMAGDCACELQTTETNLTRRLMGTYEISILDLESGI
jgi:hypothetical protein